MGRPSIADKIRAVRPLWDIPPDGGGTINYSVRLPGVVKDALDTLAAKQGVTTTALVRSWILKNAEELAAEFESLESWNSQLPMIIDPEAKDPEV